MPIGQTIGLLVIPLLLGVVFFNGIVMLVSPALWFSLPRHIALRGTLDRDKYMATSSGRFQIRVFGLMLAGVTGWMIISFFAAPYGVPVEWWLCVATCVGAIGCGVIMLLQPRWWLARYFKGGSGEVNQVALERALRVLSLPCIAIGIYFLLQCIAIP